MLIYPAIDLYEGKAVRLFKGDYAQMTVYSDNPEEIALDFKNQGAKNLHLVDLEGAKTGGTPNLETIKKIIKTRITVKKPALKNIFFLFYYFCYIRKKRRDNYEQKNTLSDDDFYYFVYIIYPLCRG